MRKLWAQNKKRSRLTKSSRTDQENNVRKGLKNWQKRDSTDYSEGREGVRKLKGEIVI